MAEVAGAQKVGSLLCIDFARACYSRQFPLLPHVALLNLALSSADGLQQCQSVLFVGWRSRRGFGGSCSSRPHFWYQLDRCFLIAGNHGIISGGRAPNSARRGILVEL